MNAYMDSSTPALRGEVTHINGKRSVGMKCNKQQNQPIHP